MCVESMRNRKTDAKMKELMGLAEVSNVLRSRCLKWFGHAELKDYQDWFKRGWKGWEVVGPCPKVD